MRTRYELRSWREGWRGDEAWEVAPSSPFHRREWVLEMFHDPEAASRARVVLAAEHAGHVPGWLDGRTRVEEVVALLAAGRLVLLRRRNDWHGSSGSLPARPAAREITPAPEVARPPTPSAQPAQQTWVEIQVLDADERPVAGRPYTLQLADGSQRSGRLGADGLIRFDDILPGPCTLLFPTASEEEWRPS